MAEFPEIRDKNKVSINRRCCYVLVVLVVVLPAVVGVVVWYLTDSACSDRSTSGGFGSSVGVDQTTHLPTQSQTPAGGDNDHSDEPWKNLRLPNHTIPVHYEIILYPDFYEDHGWFYGNETVKIKTTLASKFILIHANFLNITYTRLQYEHGEDIAIKQTFWYEENQFWVIETKTTVPPSMMLLHLTFDGSLTRANVGFYKSSYNNSVTKQERHLASSKFQPVDARRAFPCFDEPHMKANYTITLVHRPDYIALSNMPAVKTIPWEHNSALMSTHFERSVAMSTYLVCVVVCDFGNLTDKTSHGTEIRVFATPDRIAQAEYSLHVMKVTMDQYEELFKVPFPLPKNDMIAIPNFVSGAMEHWGLITYREVNMLYDEQEASAANKQRVAVVVAHEIAHMWFGNVVTMDWWDDLWLNEGFASFVECLGVHETEPQWEMLDQMIVSDVKSVMLTDAGLNSHPIVVDVFHPDQITEVFDAISYSKGASVIRMLQEIMGSELFFDGISRYLYKYEWSTAKTDDLWEQLNEVPGGYSVKEVMDTWTRQMGFPYINITFSENEAGKLSRVTATQHRFLADGNMEYDENESPFKYKWFVHLDFMDNNKYIKEWITQKEDTIVFNISTDMSLASSLVKFNVNETGFYRVNYPNNVWLRFAETLNKKGPSALPFPADRTGLVDDAFNLARGGYLGYDVALEITKYLDKENHYLPWASAYKGIQYLQHMFISSGKFDSLRKYFVKKLRPVLDRLTWEDGPSHLDKLMRSKIIHLACDFADSGCLGNATQKFRQWIEDGAKISPNIRTYVYQFGMKDGGVSDWDFMWEKYMQETVPQEQVKLLYGLAHTDKVWLLNRYLEYCKDPAKIQSQDFFTVVTYISQNPVGNSLAWDWTRTNWEYLVDRFSLGSRSLGRLVPSIISNFNTPFKLQEVDEFFAKYPEAGAGSRGREQARESIQRNIAWMNNYGTLISDWLNKN